MREKLINLSFIVAVVFIICHVAQFIDSGFKSTMRGVYSSRFDMEGKKPAGNIPDFCVCYFNF